MGARLGRMGPVGRFSLALAGVLALTAVVVAATTSYFIGRYVEDETAQQTGSTVASHFGTVFGEEVFQRPLAGEEAAKLERTVAFHFGVYDIVATRFYSEDGTVVFSYSRWDIGEHHEDPRIRQTIAGNGSSARERILTDGRKVYAAGTEEHHAAASAAATAMARPARDVNALESWVPIRFADGLRGAVVVWRDMARVDNAVGMMQLTTSAIIALAALLLWVVLRGVYVRSSNEIRRRSRELSAALVETERSYDATLSALSNALDVRDSETGGHAQRVVAYLDLIAEELDVPAGDRTVLLRGALLHDIGKIGVPDDILRKAGPLSASEWSTMRRHPSYGARIVSGIAYLDDVAEIIKHHHERWDGVGYPDGLRGEEIPLGARMFTLADAFDAMTADRPYRRAMDAVSARAGIILHSGTQFDPRVVEAFARVPLERLLRIAPHEAAQPVAELAVVA